MIHWGDPRLLPWLWGLLPLAALLALLVRRRERRLWLLFDGGAAARLPAGRLRGIARARAAAWFVAVALAAIALARPQWGMRWQEARRRSLDIVVALDASKSMRAADLRPDRLRRAKLGVGDLVGTLAGERIGLVAFAGSAFLECPLTADYAAFAMTLDDVGPGSIPRGGTDIAQALETALAAFDAGGPSDRVIVLVTDGEDHAGGLDRAIDTLTRRKVRVIAVGVGTAAGEVIPSGESAADGPLRDLQGNVVRTALRGETLQKIAAATGGVYARADDADFELPRVFERGVADLKTDAGAARLTRAAVERFPWFLGLSLLLLCVESALIERRVRPAGDDRR